MGETLRQSPESGTDDGVPSRAWLYIAAMAVAGGSTPPADANARIGRAVIASFNPQPV